MAALHRGEVVISRAIARDGSSSEIEIDGGMINHWRGTAFVPRVSMDVLLKTLQEPQSDQHMQEDVLSSRVVSTGEGSQKWAERKRRVLVIVPSHLRKQWHQELSEKFFLPCTILESKPYNDDIKRGQFRPFERDAIVIYSYQFARNKAADVHSVPWDLVVVDEAHRLRNVYKPGNIIANTLKQALAHAPKLLLTATPLQNSLLELFGLVTFLDEQIFGDLKSFREQFLHLNEQEVFNTLKARLKPVCQRTLRRQVTAYVSYTRRMPMVEHFSPDESEDRLYAAVSDYLRRDNLLALPSSQRSLMTLVLRKLLASSTFAIAGALNTLVTRLRAKIKRQEPVALEESLEQDYEALDETRDEWPEEDVDPPLSDADKAALEREIADLEQFRELAVSITHNAKGMALLKCCEWPWPRPRSSAHPRRPSSSPSRERRRTTSSGCWPTARGKTGPSCSTARILTSARRPSTLTGRRSTRAPTG